MLAAKTSTLGPRDAADVARLAAPGIPARNFLRLRDRFWGLYDASGLAEARRLDDVVNDCIAPVLDFLSAYRPMILSHPVALLARSPAVVMAMQGPANLLTVGLGRRLRAECRHEMANAPRMVGVGR